MQHHSTFVACFQSLFVDLYPVVILPFVQVKLRPRQDTAGVAGLNLLNGDVILVFFGRFIRLCDLTGKVCPMGFRLDIDDVRYHCAVQVLIDNDGGTGSDDHASHLFRGNGNPFCMDEIPDHFSRGELGHFAGPHLIAIDYNPGLRHIDLRNVSAIHIDNYRAIGTSCETVNLNIDSQFLCQLGSLVVRYADPRRSCQL